MKTVKDALAVYEELNTLDRLTFYITLTSHLNTDKDENLIMETRFPNGLYCVHYKSTHYVKNGRRKDGTQRYLCRDCGRSFLVTSDSMISGTHKQVTVWKKYLDCMMEHKTLEASAKTCHISMGTAFHWRHKILSSLSDMQSSICLSGIVEADETYTPVSYKGNHTKSKDFTMPRPAHRRGNSVTKKGLSSEQVCIPCAVNTSGIPISGVAKLGKVSSDCIERLFSKRLHQDSILCTDHEKAYLRYAGNAGVHLIQMDTDKRTSGKYGIQRINAYHSKLKGFLRERRGVSTRHLGKYLVWHDLMFCSSAQKEELPGILFGTALSVGKKILCREVSQIPMLPCET